MFRIVRQGTTEKLIIAITTSRFSTGVKYTASAITATFYQVNGAGNALEIDTTIGTNGVVTLTADTGGKTGFHSALLDVSAVTNKVYIVIHEATVDGVAAIGEEVLDIDAERKQIHDYIDASISTLQTSVNTLQTDVTSLTNEAFGKWVLDQTANTLTLYKIDGVTVLKVFNLGTTTVVGPNYISRTPA